MTAQTSPYLQRNKKRDCFHRVIATIYIISHKKVVRVRRVTSNPKKFHQVVKLAVHISAYCHRTLYFLYVWLFWQDFFGLQETKNKQMNKHTNKAWAKHNDIWSQAVYKRNKPRKWWARWKGQNSQGTYFKWKLYCMCPAEASSSEKYTMIYASWDITKYQKAHYACSGNETTASKRASSIPPHGSQHGQRPKILYDDTAQPSGDNTASSYLVAKSFHLTFLKLFTLFKLLNPRVELLGSSFVFNHVHGRPSSRCHSKTNSVTTTSFYETLALSLIWAWADRSGALEAYILHVYM